jgi:hypothetical protein
MCEVLWMKPLEAVQSSVNKANDRVRQIYPPVRPDLSTGRAKRFLSLGSCAYPQIALFTGPITPIKILINRIKNAERLNGCRAWN